MDGEPVTDEPSQDSEKKPQSYTDIFIQLCPQYMVMGMTYDEYWYSNTARHKAYREAFEMRRRNEEWSRWREGQYFFNALMCAAPVMRASFGKGKVEPGKYPEEPYPLTKKEAEEREQRRRKETYYRILAAMNAESERTIRRESEEEQAKKEASMDGSD